MEENEVDSQREGLIEWFAIKLCLTPLAPYLFQPLPNINLTTSLSYLKSKTTLTHLLPNSKNLRCGPFTLTVKPLFKMFGTPLL